jgi:hypothetical protein
MGWIRRSIRDPIGAVLRNTATVSVNGTATRCCRMLGPGHNECHEVVCPAARVGELPGFRLRRARTSVAGCTSDTWRRTRQAAFWELAAERRRCAAGRTAGGCRSTGMVSSQRSFRLAQGVSAPLDHRDGSSRGPRSDSWPIAPHRQVDITEFSGLCSPLIHPFWGDLRKWPEALERTPKLQTSGA